jgi:hypothetical protein
MVAFFDQGTNLRGGGQTPTKERELGEAEPLVDAGALQRLKK